MDQVDVIAVVGTCTPERARYAEHLAAATERLPISAARLGMSADPVDEAQALAPWSDLPGGCAIEFPAAVPVTELIGRLAHATSPARLAGIHCVVDAAHLVEDLARDDYLVRTVPRGEREFRARAMATVTQIEFATTVVLANWEQVDTERLSVVLALLSALGPSARLRLHPAPAAAPDAVTRVAAVQRRPGWIALLNDAFDPHMTDPRVGAVRFQSLRPFHPARLQRLLDEEIEPGRLGTVVRSAGFCRFATRPGVTAQWDHVGSMISFIPTASDDDLRDDEDMLSPGQDIAFIGLDLDRDGLVRRLEEACLDDAEFTAGPSAWAAYEDPFPAWARV